MNECVCGHGQNQHAWPGEAGTPCAVMVNERQKCPCDQFRPLKSDSVQEKP